MKHTTNTCTSNGNSIAVARFSSVARVATILMFAAVVTLTGIRRQGQEIGFSSRQSPPLFASLRPATVAANETTKVSITVDDIEWLSLKGWGTVSMGFNVRLPKLNASNNNNSEALYIAKITGDKRLHYSTTEIEMMEILHQPPTNPSIPPLLLAVKSMPNPFANWTEDRIANDFNCTPHHARWILRQHEISVQVQPLLHHTQFPDANNLPELARFMRSLLQALNFAHDRNVMHCDLHSRNLFYDNVTGTVHLFDWNAAFLYRPNSVYIHYHEAPTFLFPPEAENNPNATHATVSAFDVWSCGRMLSKLLCGHSSCPSASFDKQQRTASSGNELLLLQQAYDLAAQMKTIDPYQRPDTATLLRHPFLSLETNSTRQ